jgi:Malectin domain
MRTYRLLHRLTALISLTLLLSAGLLATQAASPLRSERLVPTRQAVGDFKIFLPLMQRIIAPLRIDSAASTGHTDADGNVWVADTGFIGGTAGNFGNISIANTADPLTYQTERYQLTGYALPVANGTYSVTLHFAENYQKAAGKRLFSVNVEGTPINALDVFVAAGGSQIALLRTVSATVTDGVLNINFAASLGDTMIDGLEVIPN